MEDVKKKSKAGKVFGILATVLVWVFVALSVLVTVYVFACTSNADGAPVIGGKCYLAVLTDSMSPTFEPGDMIIGDAVSGAERYELKVGDVISFKIGDVNGDDKDDINSHRIVEILTNEEGTTSGYRTQGDNESLEDFRTVSPIDVVSVWNGKRIKGIGKVFTFLYTSTGFLCCVVIPLFLVFAYEIFYFAKSVMKIKNEGKRQITAEDEEEIKRKAVEEFLRMQQNAAASAATAETVSAQAAPAAPAAGDADTQASDVPENNE